MYAEFAAIAERFRANAPVVTAEPVIAQSWASALNSFAQARVVDEVFSPRQESWYRQFSRNFGRGRGPNTR